jgi:thiol-disulfide isomerase/thioredoxin
MKTGLIILFGLFTSFGFSQKIKLTVHGYSDTTVHLVKYFGKNLYYADTAVIKSDTVEFDGSKQKAGMLGLLLPGQKFFQFVYNNEDVILETTEIKNEQGEWDFYKNMQVMASAENRIFLEYTLFISNKRKELKVLSDSLTKLKEKSESYKNVTKEIERLDSTVIFYRNSVLENYPDLLWSKYIAMTMDVKVPETVEDQYARLNYYRKHYWDNVDFNDDRMVNTPDFHSKLEFLFSDKVTLQHWDTIIKYAFELCDQLNPKSKAFEYCVSYITSTYGKSNIMGMDKVYLYMVDRYYCKRDANGNSLATWVKPDKLDELCKDIPIKKNLVIGVRPPNIILRDTTDVNWIGLYDLKIKNNKSQSNNKKNKSNNQEELIDPEYTILYFWDPECGHCKKTTPKLETLYKEKLKARNVEIFAVGKAVGEDFEKWKKFIKDNKLTFINVGVTDQLFKDASDKTDNQAKLHNLLRYTTIESLNYQTTYDIFSTPRVFVLDKDKKIIAKGISISQLEDMIDKLQGFSDLPKLFPPDPEEDEQMH